MKPESMRNQKYWDDFFKRPSSPPNRVSLEYLIQDPLVSSNWDEVVFPWESLVAEDPYGFHDGPACSRVAIVDIDCESGELRPPSKLMVPSGRGYSETGEYVVNGPMSLDEAATENSLKDDKTFSHLFKALNSELQIEDSEERVLSPEDLTSPLYEDDFIKVSAFATVLATLDLVEGDDFLGRKVDWAFEGDQLLIVPLAGWVDNAFYQRESQSLQLFSFIPDKKHQVVVRTALSSDIIVHETTHAIIDGIAPDLYHAITPQSLGIHEAIADFTAVLFATKAWQHYYSNEESKSGLPILDRSSMYSRIAEHFGTWRGHGDSLRDAWNQKALSHDENVVDSGSPHSLSEVLTGALYSVFQQSCKSHIERSKAKKDLGRRSLNWSIDRLGSLVYQGLEWLPPGDVSFADFGRAMLAADLWRLPKRTHERQWLIDEFVRRAIFDESDPNLDSCDLLAKIPLSQLEIMAHQPSKASSFVKANRDLFGIPRKKSRIRVTVTTIQSKKTKLTASTVPEPVVLIKSAWSETEPNKIGSRFGPKRECWRGTTIAISSRTGKVIERLRGGLDGRMEKARSAFLNNLVSSGHLLPPGQNIGPDGVPLRNSPESKLSRSILTIQGGYRALHISGDPI